MKARRTDTFISDLALTPAAALAEDLVVVSASALLLFAANTAMIGGYHVFLALSRDRFFPRILARRNKWFSTPHWAILITTVVPIVDDPHDPRRAEPSRRHVQLRPARGIHVHLARARRPALARRERGPLFWIGLVTTIMVGGSWAVNIVEKPLATAYGAVLAGSGLVWALAMRRDWIIHAHQPHPAGSPGGPTRSAAASSSRSRSTRRSSGSTPPWR